MSDEDLIVLGGGNGWADRQARRFLMKVALREPEVERMISVQLDRGGPDTTGYGNLVGLLERACAAGASDPDPNLAERFAMARRNLATYRDQARKSVETYKIDGKPNPRGVFWPNPKRHPENRLDNNMPIAGRMPLIDPETPIGSAGSCFASEIAYSLQDKGYNYVVAERPMRRPHPVFSEQEERPWDKVDFCADWGLLFNSPGFLQLAERAFGERKFPRLLFKVPADVGDYYIDPYREGVGFATPDAYLRNYQRHCAAVREALTTCKVFILTLGLNEYWELMADGSALSRNPRWWASQVVTRPRRLSVEQNVKCIRRFAEIVRAHNPDFELIVSVSPIPFIATSRSETSHVVVANAHSKAVLRVAAEEIVEADPKAHYFPSYELITTCLNDPWEQDLRHVTRAAVDRVMMMFDAMLLRDRVGPAG